MTVEAILSRLQGVRPAGKGRWRAQCPVHGGKNRYALAVRETDDGAVLIHCFVCEGGAGEVASAIGVDLSDFFPPNRDPLKPGKRISKPYRTSDVHMALVDDLRVAYMLYGDIVHGRKRPELDKVKAHHAQKRLGRLLSELDLAA